MSAEKVNGYGFGPLGDLEAFLRAASLPVTITEVKATPRRRTPKPKRFEVRHGRLGVIWHVEALELNEAIVFAVRVVPRELQDDCQVREASK